MNSLFKTITSASRARENVVALERGQIKEQKIFIKDLELEMFIGVFESEKGQKQRVVVSLELEVTPSDNWSADDIGDVVSYADIIDMIKDIADTDTSGHINLVETIAEMIIEGSFKFLPVQSVTVNVHKPDVLTGVAAAGVQITSDRR